MEGLLIVNADDWGASRAATDSILAAFETGAISSATGMVHMADSTRAAAIARERGLPIGLHLNLTQPFDGDALSTELREAHGRVAEHFSSTRQRRFGFDVRVLADVRRCVREQLDAFREDYGAEPTHLDGHNHIHLNPMVLSCLPSGLKVRTAAFAPGTSTAGSLLRRARQAALAQRFNTTSAFYSIRYLHPDLGGVGMDPALALSERAPVEVMCHPAVGDEQQLLMSEAWVESLRGRRLGSYADMTPVR